MNAINDHPPGTAARSICEDALQPKQLSAKPLLRISIPFLVAGMLLLLGEGCGQQERGSAERVLNNSGPHGEHGTGWYFIAEPTVRGALDKQSPMLPDGTRVKVLGEPVPAIDKPNYDNWRFVKIEAVDGPFAGKSGYVHVKAIGDGSAAAGGLTQDKAAPQAQTTSSTNEPLEGVDGSGQYRILENANAVLQLVADMRQVPYPSPRFGVTMPPPVPNDSPAFCGLKLLSDIGLIIPEIATFTPGPDPKRMFKVTRILDPLQWASDLEIEVRHRLGEIPLETTLRFYRTGPTNFNLLGIRTSFPQCFRTNFISLLNDKYGEPSVHETTDISSLPYTTTHDYHWPHGDRLPKSTPPEAWSIGLHFDSQKELGLVGEGSSRRYEKIQLNPNYDRVTAASLSYWVWWGTLESERRRKLEAQSKEAEEKQKPENDPQSNALKGKL
jgi:hypothetical protein